MRTRPIAIVACAAALLAACASDGNGDDGTAEIFPTTTTTTNTTDGDATTVPTDTEPDDTAGAGTENTGDTGETVGTAGSTTTSTTSAATTTSTTAAPAPQATTPRTPSVGNPTVASVEIGDFEAPVGVVARAGDDALYVIEQAGRIVRFDETTGERRTVADIADAVAFEGERGLLGLAFTADGAFAYLNFTDNNGDTNVFEYLVAPDGTFDTATGRLIIAVDQPYANHNGGDLAIGADGMLYIALGDGGSANDPERRASDPTTRLGTILRVDATPSATGPYTIPPDNPFAGGEFEGVAGAPEVWSWGLRNPWRIDIDPATGDLWIADVGQGALEEIDLASPNGAAVGGRGANFGWSAFEGTERFNDDVDDPGNLVFPVLQYDHGDDGCSVSGGAVYRGSAIAGLTPAYVYSDYCSGKLWALDLAGTRNLTLLEGFDGVTSVDRGPTGELYVSEQSGTIHRLVPG
jgi:glucose/arabinose dehydrogenase